MTKTYVIAGPADEIAVAALTDELTLVDGAHESSIDLEAGRLTVVGDNFSDEDVRQAAKNAGYHIEG